MEPILPCHPNLRVQQTQQSGSLLQLNNITGNLEWLAFCLAVLAVCLSHAAEGLYRHCSLLLLSIAGVKNFEAYLLHLLHSLDRLVNQLPIVFHRLIPLSLHLEGGVLQVQDKS